MRAAVLVFVMFPILAQAVEIDPRSKYVVDARGQACLHTFAEDKSQVICDDLGLSGPDTALLEEARKQDLQRKLASIPVDPRTADYNACIQRYGTRFEDAASQCSRELYDDVERFWFWSKDKDKARESGMDRMRLLLAFAAEIRKEREWKEHLRRQRLSPEQRHFENMWRINVEMAR